MDVQTPRMLVAGKLTRDFIIYPTGKMQVDVPGGNALYAAAGSMVWNSESPPGIIARVGEDYPSSWLEDYSARGMDMRGVGVLPHSIDLRTFRAFTDFNTLSEEEPVSHFTRLGIPFPRALLGYRLEEQTVDSRIQFLPTSLRHRDIPPEFDGAAAIHVCPLDYLTHSLFPALLRQSEFTTVTLDPSPGYMNPTYWGDVPVLLTGLTAFLPSEEEIRLLYKSRSADLWEMAEGLAAYGCEAVVIKRGKRGQLIYIAASNTRWEVPAYPCSAVNPCGAGDSFCGGFLAGYLRTYDLLEATLHGNVSASITLEGYLPHYALEVLPELPEARLEALRESVRRI